MNRRRVLRFIVPAIMILFIVGIWAFKNYGDTEKDAVVPTQAGGEGTSTAASEDDFALNAQTLDLEKLSSYGMPIVIDFGAGWCGPCKDFAPILDAMHEEMLGKAIIKYVDTDEHGEIASEFPIQVIPTQVFINSDGTPYQPSESINVEFSTYTYKDSSEIAFTVHQGGLTEDELRAILVDMGVAP